MVCESIDHGNDATCQAMPVVLLRRKLKRNVIVKNKSTTIFHGLQSYWWLSHDFTKIQITKLSILLKFYFHGVLEQLKTNFQTTFSFKRVLGFVIEYAWISKLLRDAAFTRRPRELSFRLKKWLFSGNFAILTAYQTHCDICPMSHQVASTSSKIELKTRYFLQNIAFLSQGRRPITNAPPVLN